MAACPLSCPNGDETGVQFVQVVSRDFVLGHEFSNGRLTLTIVKQRLFCLVPSAPSAQHFFNQCAWVNLRAEFLGDSFERFGREADVRSAAVAGGC